MFAFRSLSIGMLGACLLLLARAPAVEVRIEPPPPAPHPARATATILDVAGGLTASQVGALLHLDPGERVVAVNDRGVASDFEAAALIVSTEPRAGSYIDLTVAGGIGDRRLLVLLH